MPQRLSDSTRYLQWVARNLNHFEFLSYDARKFRNEVRRWFYGRQDAKEAEELVDRFHRMFSNNIIQDALSIPFGAILNQAHIDDKRKTITSKLGVVKSNLSLSYIVGRTIRVYGGPENDWRDQNVIWKKLQESRATVEEKIPETLNQLRDAMRRERIRNFRYGLCGYGLISTLILIAFGLMLLFQSINILILMVKEKSLNVVATQLPARALGCSSTWCLISILFCIVGAITFILVLPRMLTRLRGGFMWLFKLQRNYKQRQKVCTAIEQGLKQEGLKVYSGKVFASVQKLKQMPDHYEKEDPTTDVLGTNCLNELFEAVHVPSIPHEPAGLASLLGDMEEHHLLSPIFLTIVAAIFAVVCFPALLSASTTVRIQEKLHVMHMNSIKVSRSESAIDESWIILRPDYFNSSTIYHGDEQSFTMMALQDGSSDTFWASDDQPAWICYNYDQEQTVNAIALAIGEKSRYIINQISINMCLGDEVVFDRDVDIDADYDDVQILRFSESIEADSITITINELLGHENVTYLSQFSVLE